jgi:hypothetical protein
VRRLQANVHVAAAQIEERGPGAGQNILANDAVVTVPLSQWLKRDEVKMN